MIKALGDADADRLAALITDSIDTAQTELLASMGNIAAPVDPLHRLRGA